MHHAFQPPCVSELGLLQPVFCTGPRVPHPLPPASHTFNPALVPHAPAEGDALNLIEA